MIDGPAIGKICPIRAAGQVPDSPPHLISQLGFRGQHGPDVSGVFVGPDHDETSEVAPASALGTQPLAVQPAHRDQSEHAGCASRNRCEGTALSIPPEPLGGESPRRYRDDDPNRLVAALYTQAGSVQPK